MTNPELPQNHIPSLETVTTAYADVLEHNRRHASIGMGFKYLLKAMQEEVKVENPGAPAEVIYDAFTNKVVQSLAEDDMEGELEDNTLHEGIFTSIGVKLAGIGSLSTNSAGKRIRSTEFVPMVENTELFTGFLAQIDPEEIQEDKSHLALTTDIINSLQRTIATCYVKMPEELSEEEQQAVRQHGEDALTTFLQLHESFKRLGLEKPYNWFISEDNREFLEENAARLWRTIHPETES